ncbi:MAG: hypothetical protein NTW26_05720 [bacterium]|nr:hypothetical protein [bacterium]
MRLVIYEAKKRPARLVLLEGEDDRIPRAGAIIVSEGIAKPTFCLAAARWTTWCTWRPSPRPGS